MEKYLELCKKHYEIMSKTDILVSVYTNASGFLWSMMKVSSGTDLGWSEFNGNCELSGSFIKYEDALEDAINLIEKCDLEKFRKEYPKNEFHWGNYAGYLNRKYRDENK